VLCRKIAQEILRRPRLDCADDCAARLRLSYEERTNAAALDTGIASEYQPEYWGFDTMEEWHAAEKKLSIEFKKAEKKFHRELLKYLRGERNNIKPGTVEMLKAEIAKKLVEKDPALLLPINDDRFRKEIDLVYSSEVMSAVLSGDVSAMASGAFAVD
jgi:hypothetical protein